MIAAPPGGPCLVVGDRRLSEAWCRVLEGSGAHAEVHRLDGTGPGALDELESAIRAAGPAGTIVVGEAADRLLSVLDGPCLAGVPVGLVPMATASALDPWLSALEARRHPVAGGPEVEVLAMWKPLYLAWAERFTTALRGSDRDGPARVRDSTADRVDRAEVCRRLARGPALAIYLGHGRVRGWSGYRGLRFGHVESVPVVRPVGVLLSLTCKTLAAERGHSPFGLRWIRTGRACAVLGAVEAVEIGPLEEIADALLALLGDGTERTLGSLIAELDAGLRRQGSPGALRNWTRFRLLGDPGQPIGRFGPSPPPPGRPSG